MILNYIRIKKLQKQLVQSEILGTEKERQRIAENLHDDINPRLSLANMYLQMMDIKEEKNKQMLAKAQSIINESIASIRAISHDLSPYSLEETGLLKEIEKYINKIKAAYGIDIVLYSDLKNIGECNYSFRLAIYRIIQEAVNNVLKHANATRIGIGFYEIGNEIHIVIKDNGKGFEFSNEKLFKLGVSQGIGLKNIYNRVIGMNGTLQINSKPNQGTEVIVIVPKSFIR